MNVRPHVAQNTNRRSATDTRTARHPDVASQRIRKRIEEDSDGSSQDFAGPRQTN